jgi:hypothetical protein
LGLLAAVGSVKEFQEAGSVGLIVLIPISSIVPVAGDQFVWSKQMVIAHA